MQSLYNRTVHSRFRELKKKALALRRFNVLLDRCFATTSPYPMTSTYYDLFVGWVCPLIPQTAPVTSGLRVLWHASFVYPPRCTRDDQTRVELNGASQEARFSFEAFRFVEHNDQRISTFYLHCATRLCEESVCSQLLPVSKQRASFPRFAF